MNSGTGRQIFGSYPKGLIYGLQMFDSWLYDDNMPFDMIEAVDVFKDLKKKSIPIIMKN